MFRQFSIKPILYMLIVLVALVPNVVLFVWMSSDIRSLLLESALLRQKQINLEIKDHLTRETNRLITLLKNKSDPMAFALSNIIDRGLLSNLFEIVLRRENAIEYLGLVSLDGKIIVEDMALEKHKPEFGVESPEIVIPMHGRVHVSAPYIHDFIKPHFNFNLSLPVGSLDNPTAVLIASIDIEKFWHTAQKDLGRSDFTTYILDGRGNLLMQSSNSKETIGSTLTGSRVVRALLASKSWEKEEVIEGLNGFPVYATANQIEQLNWGVISEVSEKSILKAIDNKLTTMVFYLVLMVVIVGGIGLLLVGMMFKHIARITKVYDRVARGDFSEKLPLSFIKEINTQAIGFNHMISEIKQREQELGTLSFAVEQSLSSIMITDIQGNIQYVNSAFSRLTGYNYDEVIGQNPRILNSGKHNRKFYKKIWDDLKAGKTWEGEICNKTKNRELYWEVGSMSPIKDSKGNIINFLSVRLDNTQRKKDDELLRAYAKQLEHSNRELQSFASIASHDLQEPLRKIVTFGDRLATRIPETDAQGRDYLNRMQNSALRMRNLVEDLLQYTRIDFKARPFEPLDLNKVVETVLDDLETRISETQGAVNFMDLPVIDGDLVQIHQLFLNLIGNALKFHREGIPPVVNLDSTKMENGFWEISFEDNGIGIDEEHVDKIFQPFERLHGRTTYEGTGIGLTICNKIVARHGGEISVKRQSTKGVTFHITLPEKQTSNLPSSHPETQK